MHRSIAGYNPYDMFIITIHFCIVQYITQLLTQ